MISGKLGAWELASAVQAAVVVSSEKGFIGQSKAETVYDSPLYGDDRLNVYSRLSACEALKAT